MAADPQDVADVVEVLEDLFEWYLPEKRWQEAMEILAALVEAFPAVPTELVVRLELLSGLRIPRVGEETADTLPPPVVRERANQLIHAYSGVETTTSG